MLNKNNCFIGCESEYEAAEIVLFGAPFDGTTTYRPGARFASRRIREESYGIETFSPYLDKDISDTAVFDAGDLDLCFGNTERVLNEIEDFVFGVINDSKIPLMLGGEHLVTLGALRAAVKRYPDIYILQFDAHADLRSDYLGEQLSHSTVIRRASELTGDKRIFQLGIRSGTKEEFEYAKAHTVMTRFCLDGIKEAAAVIGNAPVYLTVDLDVIDPSEFPATGTPEAGGVKFFDLIEAIQKVGGLNIVAADINELCPPYDASGTSAALACKFLRETILSISKKVKKGEQE